MTLHLRRNYRCWICLEETRCLFSLPSWIRHDCGCDLQVHSKCLIRWLFVKNERIWIDYGSSDYYKVDSINELRRRICYVVDNHRDFQEDIDLAEAVETVPAIGQACAVIFGVAEMVIRVMFRIPYHDAASENDLWRGLPVELVSCPQCKKFIKNRRFTWNNGSYALRFYKIYRIFSKYVATGFVFWLLYSNPWKQLLKIGLWTLRQVFPESVLQLILEIPNTAALDVYTSSMPAIQNIPSKISFLIFGFPIYLAGLICGPVAFAAIKYAYPWTLAVQCSKSPILLKMITFQYLASTLLSKFPTLIWCRTYQQSKRIRPYFQQNKETAESLYERKGIIKVTWISCIVDFAVVLHCAKYLSSRVLRHMPFLDRAILKLEPYATPDECLCIQNVCSLIIVTACRKLLNFYLERKRLDELKELQEMVYDELDEN
ncbi:HER141Cp [Eremothecium sinecaudum]|uniref:HER141Cp n=1 Tax=Eremothecium sinecaudum TaxID=45286 RepID=A0A120K2F9_9SACH|nr:HER141Cp [Eremothecium sinecaudum]AMD21420.1 HER141Cp [Eremothecium sinecaudum]